MVTRAAVIARLAVAAAALALLAPGALGAYGYLHDYDLYRGFPPPREAAGIAHGRLEQVSFYSPALRQRRSYLAYLPPGYDAGSARGVRYPVLYLLHAPVGRARNYAQAGGLEVRIDTLLARRAIRPFLAVLPIGHGSAFGGDHEWADARAGRFESFVLDTVRATDSRYSTLRNRRARMLAGLSAGAYGAVNISLHHPRMFGGFESWSGYFTQTPTYTFSGASPALLRANSPAAYLPAIAPSIRRLPLRAFLYQGAADDVSARAMLAFAGELRAAGVRTRAAIYPGRHNWRLWRRHFSQMLVFASRSLESAR
ncbi:MAG TPA: alpha/beta hydrolase-fold protein [Vicinamibacteria bacterium]